VQSRWKFLKFPLAAKWLLRSRSDLAAIRKFLKYYLDGVKDFTLGNESASLK